MSWIRLKVGSLDLLFKVITSPTDGFLMEFYMLASLRAGFFGSLASGQTTVCYHFSVFMPFKF